MNSSDFTQNLIQWRNGDAESFNLLVPQVLEQLRNIAGKCFSTENPGHTLQATALVNEAYIQLVKKDISWQDRAHFFAVAARQMRFILVDHAKSRSRQKRGGDISHQSISDTVASETGSLEDFIYIENILKKLESFDKRAARIFEIKFYAGLSAREIAVVENISLATVERDLRAAKAWIANELE